MRTALEIYFGIMIFIFGYGFGDIWFKGESFKSIILLVLPILFWPAITVWKFIYYLWYRISIHTNVNFLLKHYLFNRHLSAYEIDSLNNTLKYKTGNSLKHRSWRLCVKIANKRFNKQRNGL